jgi:hypothetical protein
MARIARGWSGRQLAEHLGRDPHNVIPKSGVPRVDLVFRLARALGWSPAAVLEDLCVEHAASEPELGADFDSLNRAAYAAFIAGRFEEMISLALKAQRAASTPDERAEACLREAGGWDGVGRYVESLEALQRGSQLHGLSQMLRARLHGNLGHAYYLLSRIVEAEGVASAAIDDLAAMEGPGSDFDSDSHAYARAFALYTRGQCRRVRLQTEPESASRLARGAESDLKASMAEYERLRSGTGVMAYEPVVDTCRGGLLVVDAISGASPPDRCLERILARLAEVTDPTQLPSGYPLENIGWWCVFGCEIASRLITPPDRRDQLLGIFLNKGYEIVELSKHWALRERLLVFEYVRRIGMPEGGTPVLDAEDVRLVVDAMGRFPSFRPVGWSLLRTSPRI